MPFHRVFRRGRPGFFLPGDLLVSVRYRGGFVLALGAAEGAELAVAVNHGTAAGTRFHLSFFLSRHAPPHQRGMTSAELITGIRP